MGKRNHIDVRMHSQEREWLQNLGEGSLVEGAKNLIRQLMNKDEAHHFYEDRYGNRRK